MRFLCGRRNTSRRRREDCKERGALCAEIVGIHYFATTPLQAIRNYAILWMFSARKAITRTKTKKENKDGTDDIT